MMAPIQSIMYTGSVSLDISIFTFLLLFLVIRCLFYLLVITILYAFICMLGKTLFGVGLLALTLLTANALSSWTNDANSFLNFFSLANLLHPEKFFITISYFSVFQHAVYFPYFYIGISLCVIVIFFVGYRVYLKGAKKYLSHSFAIHDPYFHRLKFYEVKKTWINGLGFLGMLFALCLCMSFYSDINTLSYEEDKMIAYYIDHFGNTPIPTTFKHIEEEENRFSYVHEQIEQSDDPLEIRALSEQVYSEGAFKEYKNRIERLQKDISREVLKEEQTRFFFGQDKLYINILVVFTGLMILVLLYSYGKEQQSGVMLYYETTKKGRSVFHDKYFAVCSLLIIFWCILNVLLFCHNQNMYDSVDLGASMCDLQQFYNIPLNISIQTYLLLQFVMQMVVISMLIYSLLYFFSKIQNKQILAITVFLTINIPAILTWSGISLDVSLFTLFYPFKNSSTFIVLFIILVNIFVYCFYKNRKETNYA